MAKKSTKQKKVSRFNLLTRFSTSNKRTKIFISVASVLIIAGVGTAILSFASASSSTPSRANSDWFYPAKPGGMNVLQQELTIEIADAKGSYYWANQSWFINGGPIYMGLQSQGNSVNKQIGKTAVFSIFDSAIYGSPGNCEVLKNNFDGYKGRVGTSCRIPYNWTVGHTYQLTMKYENTSNLGPYWAGYVKNMNTGADTLIGHINIPRNWQGLSTVSSSWTEWFGPVATSCAAYPVSRVKFSTPRGFGTVPMGLPTNGFGQGEGTPIGACRNMQIENVPGGVIQQQGGYTNLSSPTKNKPVTTTPQPAPTSVDRKSPQPSPVPAPAPVPQPESTAKNTPPPAPTPAPAPAPTPAPSK